jgi:hypothetical protein
MSRLVVSSDAMTRVRSFRFEGDGLAVTTAEGKDDRVAWTDAVAFVRAIQKSRTESVEKSTASKLSLGRAPMTGGLLLTKKVTTQTTHTSEEREQVVYFFRQGGVPLLFALSRTRYEGLGADLRPSQIENFGTLIRLLRERGAGAPYDERLLAPRPAIERVRAGSGGGLSSVSSADGMDLLAHVIALSMARTGSNPYR